MSFVDAHRIASQQIARRRIAEPFIATPTFSEAASLAYDETAQTEMLNSRVVNQKIYWGEDKSRLREMHERGEITSDEWNRFVRRKRRGGTIDWNGLGQWANEKFDTDFDFSEETLNAKIRAASEERQKILGKAGLEGTLGSFSGTLGAYANPVQSPVNFALNLVPVGAGYRAGGTLLSTAAKTAWRSALGEVGIEAVNQLGVIDFKQRVGMEYTPADATMNLLVAGFFGASIGGGSAMVRHAWNEAGMVNLREAVDIQIDKLEKHIAETEVMIVEPLPERLAPKLEARDPVQFTEELLEQARRELAPLAEQRLTNKELKQIKQTMKDLRSKLEKIQPEPDTPAANRNVSARKRKALSIKRGERRAAQEREAILGRLDEEQAKLDAHEVAAKARDDLRRVSNRNLPDEYQSVFNEEMARSNSLTQAVEDFVGPPRATLKQDPQLLAMLDDLKKQKEFLKGVPNGVSAKQAQRMFDEELRAPEVKQVLDTVAHQIDEEANAKTVTLEGAENVEFKQAVPDDAEVPVLNDDGTMTSRPFKEMMDEVNGNLKEQASKMRKVLECVRNG